MRALTAALTALLLMPTASPALGPPRQAVVSIEMPADAGAHQRQTKELEGGHAEVRATVINQDNGRTAEVRLRFSYTIPPDTIALDEIIDRITLTTTDTDGNTIGSARLRTGEINLNPNGPVLNYRVTLYRPQSEYRVRVQVFGNYE